MKDFLHSVNVRIVRRRQASAPMNSSASLSDRQEDQAAGLCFFNQFCSATSTRVCQPSPVARKLWTTLRDSRIVMRSLVGSLCAPRAPILRLRDSGKAFRAGRNAVRSLTVSSLTSPLASISGFCFGISIHLTRVGFAETDDADSVRRFGKEHAAEPRACLLRYGLFRRSPAVCRQHTERPRGQTQQQNRTIDRDCGRSVDSSPNHRRYAYRTVYIQKDSDASTISVL